jgi:hypothetical protein
MSGISFIIFFTRNKPEQPGLTRMTCRGEASAQPARLTRLSFPIRQSNNPTIQQSNNPRATPFAYLAYFAVQFFLCVHSRTDPTTLLKKVLAHRAEIAKRHRNRHNRGDLQR